MPGSGSGPESRDSGLVAATTPRNDGLRPSSYCRLYFSLRLNAAQFSRYFRVQHPFQPGQNPSHKGGVGNPMIPADDDVDTLVGPRHAVTKQKWAGAERMKLARTVSGDRCHPEAAEIVGAHSPDIEPGQPGQAAQRQR